MNKEEIIQATINVLNGISVPIVFGDSITRPICGAVNNLQIVLEMLQKEKEVPTGEPEELKDVDFGEEENGKADIQ